MLSQEFKRWCLAWVVVLAVAVFPAAAHAQAEGPSRAERVRAATIYGVTSGALAAGGVAMVGVAVVAFPMAWALVRPFPPATQLGEPWEHAAAFASIPWLATGSALFVASAGFAVMAVTQAALLR